MAGTITLNIDGKDVKVRWNGANPPTLADVSDIEAEWRKQNAPKPKQTTAFQGAKATAATASKPKPQPKKPAAKAPSMLDILANPIPKGLEVGASIMQGMGGAAAESAATLAEDVGRGANFAKQGAKATGLQGFIPSKLIGNVFGGGNPEQVQAFTTGAESFDPVPQLGNIAALANQVAGDIRSMRDKGKLSKEGEAIYQGLKKNPVEALLPLLTGVDSATVLAAAGGDMKAADKVRAAVAAGILSGAVGLGGAIAKGVKGAATAGKVVRAGADAVKAEEAAALLGKVLNKAPNTGDFTPPVPKFDLPTPKPASVLDEVLGPQPAAKPAVEPMPAPVAMAETSPVRGSVGETVPRVTQPGDPRASIPKVRGGWTQNKIKRYLKATSSDVSQRSFDRELRRFSTPEELEGNIFYHGTGGYVQGGLKPSIALPRNAFRGGGYDQDYWAISLSKDKNTATNFTGPTARTGNVYTVLLKKDAKVIDMPNLQDAADLEDVIVDLWDQGVDAVRIGNWADEYSERELAVLNPKAIVLGDRETFQVFQKKRFDNMGGEDIRTLLDRSKPAQTTSRYGANYGNPQPGQGQRVGYPKPASVLDEVLGEPTPKPDANRAKEPWEMTREEFINRRWPERVGGDEIITVYHGGSGPIGPGAWVTRNRSYAKLHADAKGGKVYSAKVKASDLAVNTATSGRQDELLFKPWDGKGPIAMTSDGYVTFDELRMSEVESALREGKPVPAEVLADYPDLAAKYGKTAEQNTPAKPPTSPVETPQPATATVEPPAQTVTPAAPTSGIVSVTTSTVKRKRFDDVLMEDVDAEFESLKLKDANGGETTLIKDDDGIWDVNSIHASRVGEGLERKKGQGTYATLVDWLESQGILEFRVSNQSKDSRAVLSKMVADGRLEASEVAGLSDDPYPRRFRIIQKEPSSPKTPTSARQADINADREALGKAGFSTDDVRKWEELEAKANPNAVPKDDNGYKTGAWTDQETVNATAKLRELKTQIEALRKSGDDPETLVTLEDEFDQLTEAMYRSGTEQGRALAARRYTMDVDMSSTGLKARYKARASKNGTNVDPKRLAELEQIAKEYEAIKSKIDQNTARDEARKIAADPLSIGPDDPRLDPMHYEPMTDGTLYDPQLVDELHVRFFGHADGTQEQRATAVKDYIRNAHEADAERAIAAENAAHWGEAATYARQATGSTTTGGNWYVARKNADGQWVAGSPAGMVSLDSLPDDIRGLFISWFQNRGSTKRGAEHYIRNGSVNDINSTGQMGRVYQLDELLESEGDLVRGTVPRSIMTEFAEYASEMRRAITGEAAPKAPRAARTKAELNDEWAVLLKELVAVGGKAGAGIGQTVEAGAVLGKMVANRIKYGVASLDELVAQIQKAFRDGGFNEPSREDIVSAYGEYRAASKKELSEEAKAARAQRAKLEAEIKAELDAPKKAEAARQAAEAKAKKAADAAEQRAKKAAERQQQLEADRKVRADLKAKARAEREAADAKAKALREEQERILSERAAWDKRNKERQRELDRLNTRIAELEQSIEAGTGEAPKTRKPRKEDVELERLRARQTMLQSQARAIYASTQPKKAADVAVGIANMPRSLKASVDISAPGRQGWILGIANPKAAGRAFADQMRALATEEGAVIAQNQIMNRPNVGLYKRADLYLAPVDGSLNAKEEAFLGADMFSKWKKFNPVRASDRAYAAYLNRIRADVFDNMVKGLGSNPTDDQLREIARYINIASGRGDIGLKGSSEIGKSIARSMPGAAMVFWSPRNMLSRVQFATGVPLATAARVPGARKLIAKEYAKSIIATGSVIGIAKLGLEATGQGSVSGDITSSDFGKIRAGDTRIDVMAGVQQPLVLLGRLMTGKSTSPVSGKTTDLHNPKFGQPGPGDIVTRFAKSKANPIFGSLEEMYTGKDFVGQPVSKGESIANVFVPLSAKEIYDALTEEGIDKQDALVLLNIFGISTARFKDKEKQQN